MHSVNPWKTADGCHYMFCINRKSGIIKIFNIKYSSNYNKCLILVFKFEEGLDEEGRILTSLRNSHCLEISVCKQHL